MAKKARKGQTGERLAFTLKDVRHHSARGDRIVLGKIEEAIAEGRTILHEVWNWVVSNFAKNERALALLKEHAPALVPEADEPATA